MKSGRDRPPVHAQTLVEAIIATAVFSMVLGLLMSVLATTMRTLTSQVPRLGAAQGSLLLRAHVARDLATLGPLATVRLTDGPPPTLELSSPEDRETITYFTRGTALHRRQAAFSARICRTLESNLTISFDRETGQIGFEPSGSGARNGPLRGKARLKERFGTARPRSRFQAHYRNEVPIPGLP